MARSVHRAWWVAFVTLLALVSAAAFRSSTGVLFIPIEQEFGWSRTTTSGAVSLNLVLYGLTAPFAAAIMERWGVRRTVAAALPARPRPAPDPRPARARGVRTDGARAHHAAGRERPLAVLALGAELLRLWVEHERADADPLHPGRGRLRHGPHRRRDPARDDRGVRHHRHGGVGVVDRPRRLARAARRLLRGARHRPVRSARRHGRQHRRRPA